MTIKLSIKNVYGRELIYPACRVSELFCKLLNQKTLSESAVKIIEQMGYRVEFVLGNNCLANRLETK